LNLRDAYSKDIRRLITDIKAKRGEEKLTENDLAQLSDWNLHVVKDALMLFEIQFLNHSLGNPDMSFPSLGQYGQIVTMYNLTMSAVGSPYKSLTELTYRQKLALFAGLRHWCNDNPETRVTADNFFSIVSTIQKSIERDGETK
jgi:hypothetical protein